VAHTFPHATPTPILCDLLNPRKERPTWSPGRSARGWRSSASNPARAALPRRAAEEARLDSLAASTPPHAAGANEARRGLGAPPASSARYATSVCPSTVTPPAGPRRRARRSEPTRPPCRDPAPPARAPDPPGPRPPPPRESVTQAPGPHLAPPSEHLAAPAGAPRAPPRSTSRRLPSTSRPAQEHLAPPSEHLADPAGVPRAGRRSTSRTPQEHLADPTGAPRSAFRAPRAAFRAPDPAPRSTSRRLPSTSPRPQEHLLPPSPRLPPLSVILPPLFPPPLPTLPVCFRSALKGGHDGT
jgi:hypothetical protein